MNISKIAMLASVMLIFASSVFVSEQVFGQLTANVGGLPLPVDESALSGELAKQYSLWLIPSISAIGIAAFLIKRKL